MACSGACMSWSGLDKIRAGFPLLSGYSFKLLEHFTENKYNLHIQSKTQLFSCKKQKQKEKNQKTFYGFPRGRKVEKG